MPLNKKINNIFIFSFSVVALFLFYSYLITDGSMDLYKNEYLGKSYIAVWEGLTKNQFDISSDLDTVGYESFHRGGKLYVYFGIFPALIR